MLSCSSMRSKQFRASQLIELAIYRACIHAKIGGKLLSGWL